MKKLFLALLIILTIPIIVSYYKGLYQVYNYCQREYVRYDKDNQELCGLFWNPLEDKK